MSERSVLKALLCWNRLGRLLSVRSIQVGLSAFFKHVGTLIKVFTQFMSQKIFIELLSVPTSKSLMKMKLSHVH